MKDPKKVKPSQVKDLENQLKRSLADYQNLEKRVALDRESFIKFANSSLIAGLLPSLEILEKAAFHSADIGVKMALDQFRQALTNEGLEEIDPKPGDPFDHSLHDCTETIAGEPSGTVAQTLSKGYRFKDGPVIMHARVKVFGGSTELPKAETNTEVPEN